MRIKVAKVSVATLLIGVASLTFLPGCGGPAYESLLKKRLDYLRAGAPFRILYSSKRIADTPISVRIPLAFGKSYTPDSEHPDDNGPIRPDRIQPPFLPLPGFELCYEDTVNREGGRLPFYCYLAVVPNGDAERLRTDLQAKLKAKFPETPDQWDNVDAKTPEDKAVQWKRIRIEAEQPFFVGREPEPRMMPGIFELWVHEAQNNVVLIGWRTPTVIDGKVVPPTRQDLLKLLTSERQPDFSSMPALTAGTLKVEPLPDETG